MNKPIIVYCPICKSTNTCKCANNPKWKCNDCGYHFFVFELEERNA
jgi:transposase-like protein